MSVEGYPHKTTNSKRAHTRTHAQCTGASANAARASIQSTVKASLLIREAVKR